MEDKMYRMKDIEEEIEMEELINKLIEYAILNELYDNVQYDDIENIKGE